MKKRSFATKLKLSKEKISSLQLATVMGGTNTSMINCTTRPSDNYSNCCVLTGNNCGTDDGDVSYAPSINWCPTREECVRASNIEDIC